MNTSETQFGQFSKIHKSRTSGAGRLGAGRLGAEHGRRIWAPDVQAPNMGAGWGPKKKLEFFEENYRHFFPNSDFLVSNMEVSGTLN